MVAETIFVGTELLLGNIVNTNAAYLAEKLAGLGISAYYQTVVGDNAGRLTGCLQQALTRSDIIILSGGLGPTQDDITKETVAKVLNKELMLHEESKQNIIQYFEKRGLPLTENNFKQAMMPKDAVILENHNGTAPGVIMEENGKYVILLPGPPMELRLMFEESVAPFLQKMAGFALYSSMVKICGRSESEIAQLLDDLIQKAGDVTVAPYAKTGEVHIRVTGKAETEKEAKKLVKPIVKEIKERVGNDVYTTHEEMTLERSIIEQLRIHELTVTTAESCTGGLLAARLVDVPGASEVFQYGQVTYSNRAKKKFLGVKKKTLEKHDAVSEQTVIEMAAGAAALNHADVAVAVSGVAGPDGGTEERPVGLVFIACEVCGEMTVKKYQFRGNREKIRQSAVSAALTLMRSCILEYAK